MLDIGTELFLVARNTGRSCIQLPKYGNIPKQVDTIGIKGTTGTVVSGDSN